MFLCCSWYCAQSPFVSAICGVRGWLLAPYVFNVTIRINNLLVDFVLPVLTMACWAVVDRYNGDVRRELKLLVPLMAELIVVKSTGVVFVAFVLAYH